MSYTDTGSWTFQFQVLGKNITRYALRFFVGHCSPCVYLLLRHIVVHVTKSLRLSPSAFTSNQKLDSSKDLETRLLYQVFSYVYIYMCSNSNVCSNWIALMAGTHRIKIFVQLRSASIGFVNALKISWDRLLTCKELIKNMLSHKKYTINHNKRSTCTV